MFDEPQLASLCLENIDKNTGDALAAEGFTDIDLGKYHLVNDADIATFCISDYSLNSLVVFHRALS